MRKAINNNTKSSNQSEKKAFTTFTSVWGVFDEKVKDRFAWVDHHNERDAGLLAHQQCVAMWYPSTWSSPAKSLYEQTILCAVQQLLRDWSLIAGRHPMTNVCLSVSKQWESTPSIGNETPLAAPLLFNPLMT